MFAVFYVVLNALLFNETKTLSFLSSESIDDMTYENLRRNENQFSNIPFLPHNQPPPTTIKCDTMCVSYSVINMVMSARCI